MVEEVVVEEEEDVEEGLGELDMREEVERDYIVLLYDGLLRNNK